MTSHRELLTRPGGIAPRLRDLRTTTGFTGTALAAKLAELQPEVPWTQPRVSKIENGDQTPTGDDITAWVEATTGDVTTRTELLAMLPEIVEHRQFRRRKTPGAIQQDYDELGRKATLVRNVEVVWIPGLLQTPEYARYRALESVRLGHYTEDEVNAMVLRRMRRQEVLYDPAKRFEFVLSEAALRTRGCPAPVMRFQLDRLTALAELPNVTLGVIPFAAEVAISPQHGFVIFDDTVVTETYTKDDQITGEEAAAYSRVMDQLLAQAVVGDAARALIQDAIERLPGD